MNGGVGLRREGNGLHEPDGTGTDPTGRLVEPQLGRHVQGGRVLVAGV
jgi:hypothetical protein